LGTMLLKFVYTAYIWHCFFYKKNPWYRDWSRTPIFWDQRTLQHNMLY
jgi:hypothetical protein